MILNHNAHNEHDENRFRFSIFSSWRLLLLNTELFECRHNHRQSRKVLLGGPRDGALLRFSLGNEWLKAGQPVKAVECFRAAVERDPKYSAAWNYWVNAGR